MLLELRVIKLLLERQRWQRFVGIIDDVPKFGCWWRDLRCLGAHEFFSQVSQMGILQG